MVPDVSTGDFTKMFCLNCARKVVSPKSTTKYGALGRYLKFRSAFTDVVKLSFAEIDGIIADNLPMSAYRDEKWWSNLSSGAHARAWLDAGWRTHEVNLKEGYVVFHKAEGVQKRGFRRKAFRVQAKKPFTPVPHRVPKAVKPSKTRAAKFYARLKNVERKRAATIKYPDSFKPKPTHEKRLFKPQEKSQ